MAERDIQSAIQLAATDAGHRLFRVNSGMAWAGRIVARTADTITLANYRPVHLAHEGTSDLIGWRNDGLFLAVECKAPKVRTNPTRLAAQQRFISAALAAGACAGFAESLADAQAIWGK